MTKSKVFLLVLLSFIGGIILYSFIKLPKAVTLGSLIFGFFVLFWNLYKRQSANIIFGVCILFFSFGLLRALSVFDAKGKPGAIIGYNGPEKIALVGKVSAEPDIRSGFSQYVLEIPGKGGILVKMESYPEYFYGDVLKISGKIEVPESRIGGTDFDYKNYLAKDDIFWISKYPEISLINRPDTWNFYGFLMAFKRLFVGQINKILPEPQAAFLSALLVGARRSLPSDLIESFNATGTSHIVAISGYNISLIAAILFNFFGFLLFPRRLIFWLVGTIIVLFTLIAGAGASVVRAAIMGSLILIAKREGRFYDMRNAIILAGAIMLFVNPYLLRYDAGFELSFLATLGLIYISPHFEKRFRKLPDFFSFRNNLAATLSAQIATFPVVFFGFGRFSFLSVPANILVLPAVPPSMLFGFLAAIVSFVSVKIGILTALIAWFLLSYQIWVVKFLGVLI